MVVYPAEYLFRMATIGTVDHALNLAALFLAVAKYGPELFRPGRPA